MASFVINTLELGQEKMEERVKNIKYFNEVK